MFGNRDTELLIIFSMTFRRKLSIHLSCSHAGESMGINLWELLILQGAQINFSVTLLNRGSTGLRLSEFAQISEFFQV